jgi:hypothetical protein
LYGMNETSTALKKTTIPLRSNANTNTNGITAKRALRFYHGDGSRKPRNSRRIWGAGEPRRYRVAASTSKSGSRKPMKFTCF